MLSIINSGYRHEYTFCIYKLLSCLAEKWYCFNKNVNEGKLYPNKGLNYDANQLQLLPIWLDYKAIVTLNNVWPTNDTLLTTSSQKELCSTIIGRIILMNMFLGQISQIWNYLEGQFLLGMIFVLFTFIVNFLSNSVF